MLTSYIAYRVVTSLISFRFLKTRVVRPAVEAVVVKLYFLIRPMMAPSIGSALNLARLLSSFFVSPESSFKSLSTFNPPSGIVDRNGGPEASLVVEASSAARARNSSPPSTPLIPPLDPARTATPVLVDDARLLSRPVNVHVDE
jgi:hypothetical protein